MAYKRLSLSVDTPQNVENFIRYGVEDLYFRDVHCMLRLPLVEYGLDAGCNFAATNFLLSLVGGVSTVFYDQKGLDDEKYRGVLHDHYPWDEEPQGLGVESVTDVLYRTYRNPLAHSLALTNTKKIGRGPNAQVVRTTPRVPSAIAKRLLTEAQIEELECSTARPTFLKPTLEVDINGAFTLHPEGLYRGCRRMVENLTADQARMTVAAAFITAPGPIPNIAEGEARG
jgi:hypothetical protein